MVGHYQKNKHDKEIFQYTILHEMQHYITYQKQRISLSSDPVLQKLQHNNFKFFDEGVAITNGYRCLSLENFYVFHDNNIAFLINEFSDYNISDIINGWLDLFFEIPSLPIYEIAHSFTGFLIRMYNFERVLNFTIKIAKRNSKTIEDEFYDYFKSSLNEVILRWKNMLSKKGIESKENFISINRITKDKQSMIFQYKSKYPIWINKSIFAVLDNKLITNIQSLNRYRYQKQGKFKIVLKNKNKSINFYCFFRDKSQIITLS